MRSGDLTGEPFWPRLALTRMKQKDEHPAKEGNELILTGVSVGAIGLLGAAVLGAACPLCVVATPALIGTGLYKRWRGRQASKEAPPVVATATDGEAPCIERSG